jgi:hypothetical protein
LAVPQPDDAGKDRQQHEERRAARQIYLHMTPGLRTLWASVTHYPGVPESTLLLFAKLPREIVEPYDTATPPEAVRANPIL